LYAQARSAQTPPGSFAGPTPLSRTSTAYSTNVPSVVGPPSMVLQAQYRYCSDRSRVGVASPLRMYSASRQVAAAWATQVPRMPWSFTRVTCWVRSTVDGRPGVAAEAGSFGGANDAFFVTGTPARTADSSCRLTPRRTGNRGDAFTSAWLSGFDSRAVMNSLIPVSGTRRYFEKTDTSCA
jgi:hypothetical protein